MLLLRANTLALGHSGCRPLARRPDLRLPRARHPPGRPGAGERRRVRRPRAARPPRAAAHRARPGRARTGRSCRPLVALRETGLEPLELEPKEGLALLNGTQLMCALGALLLADADRLVRTASVAAAMSVEALLGTDVAFAAAYQLARPHPGQVAVAGELRHLLRDSGLQRATTRRRTRSRTRTRCAACRRSTAPSATRSTISGGVLDIELNSATDNPLVFAGGGVAAEDTLATGGGLVISGGNFHGEPIALALDFAKLALAELGSITERRTALLVDPRLNGGLPAFLAAASGIDSGLMIDQYTAAALASEHKVLALPSSADSIPTSANQEDHVSMGATSARYARPVLEHVEQIVAIELLVAAQALDLRLAEADAPAPGVGVAEAHARVRGRRRAPRRGSGARPGPRGGPRPGPRRRARGSRRVAQTGSAREAPFLGGAAVPCRNPERRRTWSISSRYGRPSWRSSSQTR